MKVVIFVETKFGLYFKCDTLWSQSERPSHAKIYSNNNIDDMKRLLQCVMPHNIYKDKIDYVKEKYDGAKLGYFLPNEDLFEDQFRIKKDVEISDLGKPTYLWMIKMNDISEWTVTKEAQGTKEDSRPSIYVESKSLCDYLDYKIENREKLLGDILKEKESE